MKINLDYTFHQLSGEPVRWKDDTQDLTLKTVLAESLLSSYKDEQIEGAEKASRYKLAMRIFKANDDVELSAEEIVLLKRLIAKMFSVLVTGQAWEYIEKTN